MKVSTLFGPPGTGKTSTLLEVMKREVGRGVKPSEIAFLTFTKTARSIAIREVERSFGLTRRDLPYFGTLHSMCFRMLGVTREFLIRGADDLVDFGKKYGYEFEGQAPDDDAFEMGMPMLWGTSIGDSLLQLDHLLRHRGATLDRQAVRLLPPDVTYFEAARFIEAYARYKAREELLDFTDLLTKAVDHLPVKVVFVDEAQDLSWLQWETLLRICADAERLYAAGDDDQAIFAWAGASPERFINLGGESRVLRHSFRMPAAVHRFAAQISRQIVSRKQKQFFPREEEGELRQVLDAEDLQLKHGEDWLVLARNHYVVRQAAKAAMEQGVPYTLNGVSSISEPLSRAIEAWEGLKQGHDLYWLDVAMMASRLEIGQGLRDREARNKIWEADQMRMYNADELNDLGLINLHYPWEAVISGMTERERMYLSQVRVNCGTLKVQPTIRFSTIHAAKGGEAERVALYGEASRRVLEAAEHDRDSELRVLYVGATRAVRSLTLVGESEVLGSVWKA